MDDHIFGTYTVRTQINETGFAGGKIFLMQCQQTVLWYSSIMEMHILSEKKNLQQSSKFIWTLGSYDNES